MAVGCVAAKEGGEVVSFTHVLVSLAISVRCQADAADANRGEGMMPGMHSSRFRFHDRTSVRYLLHIGRLIHVQLIQQSLASMPAI